MAQNLQNRPFKFGPRDRVEFIVYNSETAIICQNNASGNPIYIGRAKVGSAQSAGVWQISFHTYDASGSLLTKTWPIDETGVASTEYEFVWANRASYTYV